MNKQKGQVVILLLLIMVVALAIGLSTIGRSILEVSTSRKSEDSSRAFSAAEASIERAMKANENTLSSGNPISVGDFTSINQVKGSVQSGNLPLNQNALSYEPFDKSNFAQFWLANPDTLVRSYEGQTFEIYFGDTDTSKYFTVNPSDLDKQPGIEVTIIYWDGTSGENKYKAIRRYYDSRQSTPGIYAVRNNYPYCDSPTLPYPSITVDDGYGASNPKSYYCKVTVNLNDSPGFPGFTNSATIYPIMARVRLLFTAIAHPVALKPTGAFFLPKQGNIYHSAGTSGDVKRTLELKNYRAVMPFFFDYVLFSANNLAK